MTVGTGLIGGRVPGGFLPEEDQGYLYAGVQLPDAASLQRTQAAVAQMEKIIMATPGRRDLHAVSGYSMLAGVTNTTAASFFITLKPWEERKKPEEQYEAIMAHLNRKFAGIPQGRPSPSPPGHPGDWHLRRRDHGARGSGRKGHRFPVGERPEIPGRSAETAELARVTTTFIPTVPQVFVGVDRDKVLKQGVNVSDVYQTLQTFMGAYFVNYFNRFGRQWQVYVQAEGSTGPGRAARAVLRPQQ